MNDNSIQVKEISQNVCQCTLLFVGQKDQTQSHVSRTLELEFGLCYDASNSNRRC